ncbi:MAG: outer membrane lipoprotein-sorting protein [Acidobacteria bacterium]|nr:outer membrane lipoprotein-sorting protein [Acidobacteriota bacterium]
MSNAFSLSFLLTGLLASVPVAQVRPAINDAQQIVEEGQRRAATTSERYSGLLQSFNADGKTSEKRWMFERIGSHGKSRTIIRFTEPAEVAGVALLIVNHPERASDQWMWTPALQRDRRIALQDRSARFFGTDFSFEDLEERVAEQYDYTLLAEEPLAGAATWKIGAVPKRTRSSQYSKQTMWIRKDDYVTVRIDSYVKDQVVRRLQSTKILTVQGIPTAHELEMTDLPRGSRTRLALEKVLYNLPLKESDFTVGALRR